MGPWNLDKRNLPGVTGALLAVAFGSAALNGHTWNRPFNRTFGCYLSSPASASVLLWLIRFRNSRAINWLYLGKIACGAYVLHIPIREAVEFALRNLAWHLPGGNPPRVPICIALSIGCASLLWHALEEPLMRLKDRLVPLWARGCRRCTSTSAGSGGLMCFT
jgi:peptidoglycan/LPS O-acetylase OafA/YrhL